MVMEKRILHPKRVEKAKKDLFLSVVFSFRNEEDVLDQLVTRIRTTFQKEIEKGILKKYELIFVNDDSTDKSFEILTQLSKGHNDIKILNMSRCFGVSPCALAGMQYSSGDVVVYMDADLQDPPELIPKMMELYLNDEDVEIVHTVRASRSGESTIKLFITKIGYFILNKVTSVRLPIEAGDFKLLSRRAVDHLVELKEKRPFLRGLVCWIGFKQEYLSYHRESRPGGKTKFPVFSWNVIFNFFESALISFSSIPLRIASILGLVAIIFDLILLAHVLIEKFKGQAIPGWTAIMIAVLFIGSVQLFCVGIIGMYLNTVYDQSKGRPNYIIESTFGFESDQT